MKRTRSKIVISLIGIAILLSVFFYGPSAMETIFFDTVLQTTATENANAIVLLTEDQEPGEKIDYINLKFNDKTIFVGDIISRSNRYFIPINKFAAATNASMIQDESIVNIRLGNQTVTLDISNDKIIKDTGDIPLTGSFLLSDNYYISIFELCESLSLYCDWDNASKTISFITGHPLPVPSSATFHGTRQALIRLEDIAPVGNDTSSFNDLLKQRTIADYLYSKGIPFSIALVPRYINPENGIDNNIAEDYSFYNAEFIYTLDYYKGRGGTIGLHGYTHQSGSGKSLYDKEFGKDANLSPEEFKERIKLALEACETIGIKPAFFAFPHYICTLKEYNMAAKYFDCLYQTPLVQVSYLRQGLHKTKLVPTPLHYVDPSADRQALINQIQTLDKNTLMSLFFHPFLEYEHIEVTRSSNSSIPIVTYPQDSPLHEIIDAMQGTGARFIGVTEVK